MWHSNTKCKRCLTQHSAKWMCFWLLNHSRGNIFRGIFKTEMPQHQMRQGTLMISDICQPFISNLSNICLGLGTKQSKVYQQVFSYINKITSNGHSCGHQRVSGKASATSTLTLTYKHQGQMRNRIVMQKNCLSSWMLLFIWGPFSRHIHAYHWICRWNKYSTIENMKIVKSTSSESHYKSFLAVEIILKTPSLRSLTSQI